MKTKIAILACLLSGAAHAACDYDRAQMLALSELKFDQDMEGGWRAIANKPGCNLVAADLLRDYRAANRNEAGILYWHEAQLRAFEGQAEPAAALMVKSYKPEGVDSGGWGPYVEATIAFLRKDRPALDAARERLAAVPPPTAKGAPPVINGYMEVKFSDGQTRKIRWPPNIEIVEGFQRCFDKSYNDAYGDECRTRAD